MTRADAACRDGQRPLACMLWAKGALLLGLGLGLLSSSSLLRAEQRLQKPQASECVGDAWQRLLHAVPWPAHARAVWLDGRRLRWTGLPAGSRVLLATAQDTLALTAAPGDTWLLPPGRQTWLREALRGALTARALGPDGQLLGETRTQAGAAIDALHAAAAATPALGATVGRDATSFRLWAPTAHQVYLCLYDGPEDESSRLLPLQRDARTGIWHVRVSERLNGRYYRYLVDVAVPGHGWVRNRVTDPYAVSLSADSARALVADLDDPTLMPEGWRHAAGLHRRVHARAPHPVDMALYELHVRDFSAADDSVPEAARGRYAAFAERDSNGMRQLRSLAKAGITDLHLLPVFDLATVPERGCVQPVLPTAAPDGPEVQAAVRASAAQDCFNWGYDPYHFNAPEGSYASDAMDGRRRIVEFRALVLGLHRAGLRVGMDVVYNHMTASGQQPRSVLDRIVPGYYHRLDGDGAVHTSTCCDNTATERLMMARLMVDSLLLWARHYRIDSFRFDLMGHQPRALMEQAHRRLRRELGRSIHFIGEGWNFGEVADNRLFRQASQLSLNGSGIGSFNDRMRDAARGGAHDDSGEQLIARQGWLSGLHTAPNARATETGREALMARADLLRLGLAGTLRSVRLQTLDGSTRRGDELRYHTQPAGYASQPSEVVNYVENHDNQTLWDLLALRLPEDTPSSERARVQMLGAALVAFSQGIPYFHAGMEALRSKSLDRNSFDSGDVFNRLDWRFDQHTFAVGLPPEGDNGRSWEVLKPVLRNPLNRATRDDLTFSRRTFEDLVRIRASSSLFRLRRAEDVSRRLQLLDTGPQQNPAVLAAHLDGRGLRGANFSRVLVLLNTHPQAQTLELPPLQGVAWQLHPVHRATDAGDPRPREQARHDAASGRFTVPGRTAVVWVSPA